MVSSLQHLRKGNMICAGQVGYMIVLEGPRSLGLGVVTGNLAA